MPEAASAADEESQEDRAHRYRALAQESHDQALKAESPNVRAAYLQLAAQWLSLSESMGRIAPAEKRTID
jgi:hypothetical protein